MKKPVTELVPLVVGRPADRAKVQQLLREYQMKAQALMIVSQLLGELESTRAQESAPAKLAAAIRQREKVAPDIVIEKRHATKRHTARTTVNGHRPVGYPSGSRRRKAESALTPQRRLRLRKLRAGDQLVAKAMVLFLIDHMEDHRFYQAKDFVPFAQRLGYHALNGLAFVSALNNGLLRRKMAIKNRHGYRLTAKARAYGRTLRAQLETHQLIAPGGYSRIIPTAKVEANVETTGVTAH